MIVIPALAMATPTATPCCTRCSGRGHTAAFCSKPFMRQLCSACGRMGHGEADCPARRREEREAAKAERKEQAAARAEVRAVRKAEGPMCYLCGQHGHLQSACPLRHRPVCLECGLSGHVRRSCPTLQRGAGEQPRLQVACAVDDDARSELSAATLSTAASTASAVGPVPEEKEIKRLEKKLREVSKLEARAAAGERLEANQLEKVKQRADIEIELDTLRGLAEARARNAARKVVA